jgi:hypothetical protein
MGWIGVDFDGTLAEGHAFCPAVPAMVKRVQEWIRVGIEVRIVTARAADPSEVAKVRKWLDRNGLPAGLPITDRKDYDMIELWDDRAVRVLRDRGVPCCDALSCDLTVPTVAAQCRCAASLYPHARTGTHCGLCGGQIIPRL